MRLISVEKRGFEAVSGKTLRIEEFVTGQRGRDNVDDDDDDGGDFFTAIPVVDSRNEALDGQRYPLPPV